MKYFLIGDEDAVLGFGMVGVESVLARDSAEAARALEKAFADPQVGVIFILEALAAGLRDKVDEFSFSRDFPLILEIPGREGSLRKESLRELVNEAIGIKL